MTQILTANEQKALLKRKKLKPCNGSNGYYIKDGGLIHFFSQAGNYQATKFYSK